MILHTTQLSQKYGHRCSKKKDYQFARKKQGKVDFRLISNKYSSKIISY